MNALAQAVHAIVSGKPNNVTSSELSSREQAALRDMAQVLEQSPRSLAETLAPDGAAHDWFPAKPNTLAVGS